MQVLSAADAQCRRTNDNVRHVRELQQPLEVLLINPSSKHILVIHLFKHLCILIFDFIGSNFPIFLPVSLKYSLFEMIFFFLPAVLASSVSVIDFARRNIYSKLEGIGIGNCDDKKLHPDEYLLLHSEHRSANFRKLWKGWCKDLNTRESFEAAKEEIGEEKFWKIVNGECLFLGPMKWMTSEDVKAVKCAPLLNVPFNEHTQYVLPDEAMLVALLDKNVEYKSKDSFAFLVHGKKQFAFLVLELKKKPTKIKPSKNLPVIEEYLKKLSWDHPHWEVLTDPYYKTIDITRIMPPSDKLDAQNLSKVLSILSYVMSSTDDKSKNEIIRQLEASSLKEYANYLNNKPLSWAHFEAAFNSIPESDYMTRISWALSNNTLLVMSPYSKQIRSWIERFPAVHSNAAVMASVSTRYADDVPVPEWFMAMAEDDTLCQVVSSQLLSFSLEQQVKFLSWNSRVLPPSSELLTIHIDCSIDWGFGSNLIIYDQAKTLTFPSIPAYNMVVDNFEAAISESPPTFPSGREVQIVKIALAHGFPLPLSRSSIDFLCDENNESAFSDAYIFSNVQLRKNIMEYMTDASNAQKLSQFKASDEVIDLIKFCNSSLSSYSQEQLAATSTEYLLKYVRRQCLQVHETGVLPMPVEEYRGLEIAKSILTLSDEKLHALFKNRTEEVKEQILQVIPLLGYGMQEKTNALMDKIRKLDAADGAPTNPSTKNNNQPKPKKVSSKQKEKKSKKNRKNKKSNLLQVTSEDEYYSLEQLQPNDAIQSNQPKNESKKGEISVGFIILILVIVAAIVGGASYLYLKKRKFNT